MGDEAAKKPEADVVRLAPGPLTSEQRASVHSWFEKLKSQGSAPRCPICESVDWTVPEHLVSPSVYAGGGSLFLGGVQYPHFMLACTKCGNVQFINAVITGVVKVPGVGK